MQALLEEGLGLVLRAKSQAGARYRPEALCSQEAGCSAQGLSRQQRRHRWGADHANGVLRRAREATSKRTAHGASCVQVLLRNFPDELVQSERLEDLNLVWLKHKDWRFVPFSPPAVGESIELAGETLF